MGVKIAAAMGAQVVLFTTSADKRDDALRLGAHAVVVSKNADEMAAHANSFDLIVNTVAAPHNLDAFLALLKLDGTLIENLTNDPVSQTIAQALFQIGKAMEKSIIAKSVQDAESLALLWNYGADYVQGNYFQPPSQNLDYQFTGESIDSDQAVAGWAKT